MSRHRVFLLAVALAASLLAGWLSPSEALAVDRNFVGSAQLDYHFVPTVKEANASRLGFDGFTLEAGLKLAVDFSDNASANVKVCYTCHGFEMGMAQFDYRVTDSFNLRVGRFSPSFGNFNGHHDPANHHLSDKPLPYDMGQMLRRGAWNNGVLPSPFPDNGIEVSGRLPGGGEGAWFDYAAYAVKGFQAQRDALDLDFIRSRSLYYTDGNGRPAIGGRVGHTRVLGAETDATLGASLMHGTFDPDNDLTYTILGLDLVLRLSRTNVRLEYLVRRQEIDVSNPTRFKYAVPSNGDFFAKHGFYSEVEQPLTSNLTLLGRFDGMIRRGNVFRRIPGEALPAYGELDAESSMLRYTLGTSYMLDRGMMLKTSAELWQFSSPDAAGHELAFSTHAGIALSL